MYNLLRSRASGKQHEKILSALFDSGLFSEQWYIQNNPDVKTSESSAIEHYYFNGSKEGRSPNYLFDPSWYLDNNSDVKKSGLEPLSHYVLFGDLEGRQPSIYFSPTYYRKQLSLNNDNLALTHFLSNVTSSDKKPIPEFDTEYYVKSNNDVASTKGDPYRHFLERGSWENRNPNSDFDMAWYKKKYLAKSLQKNAFTHYLLEGKATNIPINVSFELKQKLRLALSTV